METNTDTKKPSPPNNPAVEKLAEGKAIDNFTSGFLGKEKAEEKPPGEKPPPKPDAKPEKPKPKAARKPAPAAASPPTLAEVTEAAARGVASVLEKKTEEKKETESQKPELPPGEQKRIGILSRMEELNPAKYKGISKKYEASMVELAKYADKWEAEHPGETFDENADEHRETKAKLEEGLDWDEDEYTDALADIKANEVIKKTSTETNEKLSRIEQAEKLRRAEPEIAVERAKAALDFFGKLEGFEEFLKPDGSQNTEAAKALAASDPVATEIAMESADLTEKLIEESYKLFNMLTPYDPSNPLHPAVDKFILGTEARLAAQPPEDQKNSDGLPFMPAAQYWKLDAKEQKKYWTLKQPDIAKLLVNKMLKQAQQRIKAERDKFERTAAARGFKPGESAPKPPTPPVRREEKPRTPVVTSAPRTDEQTGEVIQEEPQDKFTKSFLANSR